MPQSTAAATTYFEETTLVTTVQAEPVEHGRPFVTFTTVRGDSYAFTLDREAARVLREQLTALLRQPEE